MTKKNHRKMERYDFNINISQIGAKSAGISPGEITLDELAILSCFIKYVGWAIYSEKILVENETYYHFPWNLIVQRIPYLKAQKRSTIKLKMKKLVDIKLLKSHPDNSTLTKSFYAFGEKYPAFINIDNPSEKTDSSKKARKATRPKNRTAPSESSDRPVRKIGQHPSEKSDSTRPKNRTIKIIDKIIDKDTLSKSVSEFLEKIKPEWQLWQSHLQEKWKEKYTKTQAKMVLMDLHELVEGDHQKAVTNIRYSIKGGWKSICQKGSAKKNSAKKMPDRWNQSYYKSLKEITEVQAYILHLKKLGYQRKTGGSGVTYYEKPETVAQ